MDTDLQLTGRQLANKFLNYVYIPRNRLVGRLLRYWQSKQLPIADLVEITQLKRQALYEIADKYNKVDQTNQYEQNN